MNGKRKRDRCEYFREYHGSKKKKEMEVKREKVERYHMLNVVPIGD